jgi:hypothetical protein
MNRLRSVTQHVQILPLSGYRSSFNFPRFHAAFYRHMSTSTVCCMLVCLQCTLQQYVDDMFSTILRVDDSLPPAVRFLFNFLDNAAARRSIADPEVVHTWKSNRLESRFTAQLSAGGIIRGVLSSAVCERVSLRHDEQRRIRHSLASSARFRGRLTATTDHCLRGLISRFNRVDHLNRVPCEHVCKRQRCLS